MTDCSRV